MLLTFPEWYQARQALAAGYNKLSEPHANRILLRCEVVEQQCDGGANWKSEGAAVGGRQMEVVPGESSPTVLPRQRLGHRGQGPTRLTSPPPQVWTIQHTLVCRLGP